MENLAKVWAKSGLSNGDADYRPIIDCYHEYMCKCAVPQQSKDSAIATARKLRKVVLVAEKQGKFRMGCGDNVQFNGTNLHIGYRLEEVLVKDGKINWPLILLRLSRVKTL